MKWKCKLVFLSLAGIFSVRYSLAQTWQWKTSSPGHYSVGYKVVTIKSFNRPYAASPVSPRILPLHIWYPAVAGSKRTMKFMEYVRAEQNPSWGEQTADEVLHNRVKTFADSANVRSIAKTLAGMSTLSVRNAIAVGGRFPVVLLGNGLSTPGFLYTLMAEYLASHGYVVVAMPSIPENTVTPFTFSERGLLNQVSDMETAFDEITKLPFADKEKLALVSWSVGGAAQILFQMKHKTAKALVSLDAGSQYEYGRNLITHSIYYDSLVFNTPLLNLTAAKAGRFQIPRSTFFFDTLASDKKQVSFLKLGHPDCLSFSQYITELEKPDETIHSSYEKMCEITRLFLDFVISAKADAGKRLQSIPAAIPE